MSSPAFHALALVAAARTALGASRQIRDRRAGRDPSGQEPEPTVRRDLDRLRDLLAADVVRLRLRAVVGTPAGRAALVQAFEDRILLDDVARTLARIHQKLLSLYPVVPESLVEDVRQLAVQARSRAEAPDPEEDLGSFASHLGRLVDDLQDVLDGGHDAA
ncbi:MAG: hypothetical protein AAGK21_05455 [Bacteroidota bacterium]